MPYVDDVQGELEPAPTDKVNVGWKPHTELILKWSARTASIDIGVQNQTIKAVIKDAIKQAQLKLLFGVDGINPFSVTGLKFMGYQALEDAAKDHELTGPGDFQDRMKYDVSSEYSDPLVSYVSQTSYLNTESHASLGCPTSYPMAH
jgi:hypothetical protein